MVQSGMAREVFVGTVALTAGIVAAVVGLNNVSTQSLRREAVADARIISPGFSYPIEIVVEKTEDMPRDGIHGVIVARTTVRRHGDGACVLHLTDEALRFDKLTIAHETAHCVLQHDYLGENGYLPWVTAEMVWKFEEDAKVAARKVLQ